MDQATVARVDEVVVVAGEIDLATAPMLDDAISAISGAVVLDLSGVTFMDSSGVRVLVRHRQTREASGDRFDLVAVSRPVRRVLEMAGILGFLDVADVTADESPEREVGRVRQGGHH
jgi:anti-sigma B factor antagonist